MQATFSSSLCPGLLVTGTDTGIGKTFVSSIIAREVSRVARVGVFKPACSGAEPRADGDIEWPDLEALRRSVPDSPALDDICPYRLRAPLAPPVAARREGVTIDYEVMVSRARRQRERHEFVVVEGVGGWLCPLTEQHTISDFAETLGLPVVVVARLGLGTINHTLLTIESIQRRAVPIVGIVLNDAQGEAGSLAGQSNVTELAHWAKQAFAWPVPVLGVVPFGGESVCLSGSTQPARIDWRQLAQPLQR